MVYISAQLLYNWAMKYIANLLKKEKTPAENFV